MSPASRWRSLADEVNHGRCVPKDNLRDELRARVAKLSRAKVCHERAPWWISEKRSGSRREVYVAESADEVHDGHRCIRLTDLGRLPHGLLGFRATYDTRGPSILSFVVAIVAEGWFARIDLTEAQSGQGPCGHPLLHCHIGANPAAKPLLDPRVPLPSLTPWEALDWILATLDERFEPQ